MKEARKAAVGDSRQFYDQAAAALAGYLADRFNLPAIALAGDMLERTLGEKSIPEDVVRDTLSCLQECDFGRFVAAAATPEKTAQIAARIHKIVDALERAV